MGKPGSFLPLPRPGKHLSRSFFLRSTLFVARNLLGMRLVKLERGRRLSGIIVETEAYIGEDDLGCHASRGGLTSRNAVMFGPPGHAYVYFTYGMHWLLNLVTEREGFPAAVLIRAMIPEEGIGSMQRRRAQRRPIAGGPAMLCQALALDGRWNGVDLCADGSPLYLEKAYRWSGGSVFTEPRVGLKNIPEPWRSIPWRFRVSSAIIPDSRQ